MEHCHYCDACYHPMPVYRLELSHDELRNYWRNGDTRPMTIHVCHGRYEKGKGWVSDHTCRDKAEADGYEYRRDLTPRR